MAGSTLSFTTTASRDSRPLRSKSSILGSFWKETHDGFTRKKRTTVLQETHDGFTKSLLDGYKVIAWLRKGLQQNNIKETTSLQWLVFRCWQEKTKLATLEWPTSDGSSGKEFFGWLYLTFIWFRNTCLRKKLARRHLIFMTTPFEQQRCSTDGGVSLLRSGQLSCWIFLHAAWPRYDWSLRGSQRQSINKRAISKIPGKDFNQRCEGAKATGRPTLQLQWWRCEENSSKSGTSILYSSLTHALYELLCTTWVVVESSKNRRSLGAIVSFIQSSSGSKFVLGVRSLKDVNWLLPNFNWNDGTLVVMFASLSVEREVFW